MSAQTARKGMTALAVAGVMTLGIAAQGALAAPKLEFQDLWTAAGQGAEIVAIDQASGRVFVTAGSGVEVRSLADGSLIGTFSVPGAAGVQSVAVKNGIVAVAAQPATKTDPGSVAFFDAGAVNPDTAVALNTVTVGALPDMLIFSPDGSKVVVADEGEPNDDYSIDPVGSISVIDLSGGVASATVATAGFSAFNGTEAAIEAQGGRIFGPGASVAEDLEPEYIAISPDGTTAWVTLQENNAIAVMDLSTATVTAVRGLGYKDHSLPGNEMDASDRDGIDGNLRSWPVRGMYQPDGIASYQVGGSSYYVTANEGDARDYDPGLQEEDRVKHLTLDLDNDDVPDTFSSLQDDDQLGRLNVTNTQGDIDGDGNYEELFSFGARSFSIWDAAGNQVFDSGAMIESIIANDYPAQWADGRSDNKGPEPESIEVVGIGQWFYALVGLERTNGVMVFDITDPFSPAFQDYILTAGDLGPEGIDFSLIWTDGFAGTGYVAVANEVSGTTTLYRVTVPVPPSLALLGLGLVLVTRLRRRRPV